MLQGFKNFIARGNVIDLAVGVIIGAAVGEIVNSLVKDLITPMIGMLGGQPDFSAEVTNIKGLAEKPDLIMTAAYEPDFPAFIQQLRAAGFDV